MEGVGKLIKVLRECATDPQVNKLHVQDGEGKMVYFLRSTLLVPCCRLQAQAYRGGGGDGPSPLFLGHFAKNFSKRVFFLIFASSLMFL